MELIKKQIHMNQWKGNAVTQITLDEDFIVPDTLEDMDQVILDNARILGENGRIQDEKNDHKRKKWNLRSFTGRKMAVWRL